MRTHNDAKRPEFTPEFITQLKAGVFRVRLNFAWMHGGGPCSITCGSACRYDLTQHYYALAEAKASAAIAMKLL